jgi:hypothetical protein
MHHRNGLLCPGCSVGKVLQGGLLCGLDKIQSCQGDQT